MGIGSLDYGSWDKPQYLSPTGGPGKTRGIIQSEPKDLRTKTSDAWEQKKMVQLKKKETLSWLCIFVQSWPSVDWMMPVHIGHGRSYVVYWFKCWSPPETLSRTHPERMFPAYPLVRLRHKINYQGCYYENKASNLVIPAKIQCGCSC